MKQNSLAFKLLIYSLVFFAGFANLATEIIGPRLVASLFGSTTIIRLSCQSTDRHLIGYVSRRVSPGQVLQLLPILLAKSVSCWQSLVCLENPGVPSVAISRSPSLVSFFLSSGGIVRYLADGHLMLVPSTT
jgi:hypothetical protein